MVLVARTCCDPNRATQCHAHTVVSRQIPTGLEMSQECRATTPPKDRFAPVFSPPRHSCARSVLERRKKIDVRLEGGGVALEVPEMSQENVLPKTDRATRGVATTLTPIALHCAAKILCADSTINCPDLVQKNPRVRKMFVRNSGAGNGCADFMDTWKKCVLSAGKTSVHKIPPFWGGGILGFLGRGGGSADFIFMGARIFLSLKGFSTPTPG